MSCVQFVFIRPEYLLEILQDDPLISTEEPLLVQKDEISFVLSKPRFRPLQLFIWGGRPDDEIVKEIYNIQKLLQIQMKLG